MLTNKEKGAIAYYLSELATYIAENPELTKQQITNIIVENCEYYDDNSDSHQQFQESSLLKMS
jgi:hypothetical protein